MKKKEPGTVLDITKKNRRKNWRTLVQFVVLGILIAILIKAVFNWKQYEEIALTDGQRDKGFIAVSYFGVARTGTDELMDKKQIEEQLRLLKEHGYSTISQQDIIDYYLNGKELPEKALFLAFEDGRNDSELFVQPYLEKNNFKATMLTYANKMGNSESKFIQPKELKKMSKTGYWETGTNGYRLAYINIQDKNGNYFPLKDQKEFVDRKDAIYYTHYLMDFIRDSNEIPLENKEQMESRISTDYELMKTTYLDKLGYIPGVYMIMHANSLYNGMNSLVQNANDQHINNMFAMHFNREGKLLNTASDTLMNLTRVQPKPYWQTNHLLMKLQFDTGNQVRFVTGNKNEASNWNTLEGATEFKAETVALTSPPGGEGLVELNNGESFSDTKLSLILSGHKKGNQFIYLRSNQEKNKFIRISLKEQVIIVEQKEVGEELERLLAYSLPEGHDGKTKVELKLQGNSLDLYINGVELLNNEPISPTIREGSLMLGAEAVAPNYKEARVDPNRDLIYDGVFEQITAQQINAEGKPGQIQYTNVLNGWQKVMHSVQKAVDKTIDWAMKVF